MIDYSRRILELDDTELEKFVLAWVAKKTSQYFRTDKFSGAGDMGRDVVGFVTKELHDGPWDNYQCKQLGINLGTGEATVELGKILYYSFKKKFSVPRAQLFVAPRGVNRNLQALFNSPSAFRQHMINTWALYCQDGITESESILLTPELEAHIKAFDYSSARHISLDQMLLDTDIKSVLFSFFGADPGAAPKGSVPAAIADMEVPYVTQLVDAYGERNQEPFPNPAAVEANQDFGPHLRRQRERFYDADAFLRFYRDNTSKETIEDFSNDIFHGVVETCDANYPDSLARADAVMTQAANVQPGGPLSGYAKVPVKQGVCHHYANEAKLTWKKK